MVINWAPVYKTFQGERAPKTNALFVKVFGFFDPFFLIACVAENFAKKGLYSVPGALENSS